MVKWGMVIDLRKCVGCGTCVMACKVSNHLPKGVYFTKVLDYEEGSYPNVKRKFLVVQCMHCEEPPCLDVCPTGATYRRDDGAVLIDHNKCIGCKSCIMACPYGARSYIEDYEAYYKDEKSPFDELIEEKWRVGVTVKCTLCVDRIDENLKKGLKPGVDAEATPMCVVSCITGARYFGDLDDPESEVSRLLKTGTTFQLRQELGTKPKIYYLR